MRALSQRAVRQRYKGSELIFVTWPNLLHVQERSRSLDERAQLVNLWCGPWSRDDTLRFDHVQAASTNSKASSVSDMSDFNIIVLDRVWSWNITSDFSVSACNPKPSEAVIRE